jgi:hypothetical protein
VLLERLARACLAARRDYAAIVVLGRARDLADRAGRYDMAAGFERQIAAAKARLRGRRP